MPTMFDVDILDSRDLTVLTIRDENEDPEEWRQKKVNDANLIVQAVNAYPALTAENKRLREALELCADQLITACVVVEEYQKRHGQMRMSLAKMDRLKAELKATGLTNPESLLSLVQAALEGGE